MWSFENDPEFQPELDWIDTFVREKVQPLDYLLGSQWNIHDPEFTRLVRPLQAEVQARGLWACHLGPELGGKGYGQLKLALMNEKFGMSRFGPIVFGCQAPDSGNAEILAHYGTDEQKETFLYPLLANEIVSCFSMTEPQGGADPLVFTAHAEPDGDEWVINGEKWFASEADHAAFFILMVVTDPDTENPYRRMSMFIVPATCPASRTSRITASTGNATIRTPTCDSRTSVSRRRTCSVDQAMPSSSPRSGSAVAACITRCVPSLRPRALSR